ncbi:MAG: phosphodiester glycosidase family protein [Verrucomicrobia bacterium]|nr:phosphodiester glycosidase family protein [Verrucomicrobiota bacterium]
MNSFSTTKVVLRCRPWVVRALGTAFAGAVLFPMLALGQAANAKNPHGFSFIHDELDDGPVSVRVFKVARSSPDWDLVTTLGGGATFGMSVVSEQVRAMPAEWGHPVAAINGDFYDMSRDYPGDPEGLTISRGELWSGPCATRACFYLDAQGNPHRTNIVSRFKVTWPNGATTSFGLNEYRASDEAVLYTTVVGHSTRTYGGREFILERQTNSPWLPLQVGKTYSARVRAVREGGNSPLTRDTLVLSLGSRLATALPTLPVGATIQVSTATLPDITGATVAIGGGPSLVSGGKAKVAGFLDMRHPRSAVGWSKDHLFLVQVDGRQRHSVGMTYSELAHYMIKKLGCQEALNLDGGGSATIWVYGQVVNNPSQGRQRPSANALVVVLKKKPGSPPQTAGNAGGSK